MQTLADTGRVTLDGISFDFNRTSLRPESLSALIAVRDAVLTLGGDWQIAAHTDDRGHREYNQALSEQRAMAVHDWLVGAGVDTDSLSGVGFGHDQPIADNAVEAGRSANQRVELVGAVMDNVPSFGGLDATDSCPATSTAGTHEGVPPPPPITEWTGTGGYDWLPFSYLAPVAAAAGERASVEPMNLSPGAQPQVCQALCAADTDCAAFSFEPAASDIADTATCALFGNDAELALHRDNSRINSGGYRAAGLKPGAMPLLTPQGAGVAQSLLADLAQIADLRAAVEITAPETHAPDAWMAVDVDGAVPSDRYDSFVQIARLGDYSYAPASAESSLSSRDMIDGRSGHIWVPGPGDYVLRYVINHPTASLHVIAEQALHVPAPPDVTSAPVLPEDEEATLTFPLIVAPGETFPVSYSGPLFDGDWIDIIPMGDDDDMSGGLGWDWATGQPVALEAPVEAGEYSLRYVVDDPQTGRKVLAHKMLVVRAPLDQADARPDIRYQCDGPGLTPCDVVLPEDDIAMTLLPGYGITIPILHDSSAGGAAGRPSFDVVRTVDGESVVMVNSRQADAVYCQDGLAGDVMCVTGAVTDADGIAVAFVLASLGSAAMAAEMDAMWDDEPGTVPGDLQGVWFANFHEPERIEHDTPFIMMELFQDDGADEVFGYFVTAPDVGPVRDMTGDITGRLIDGVLSLTLAMGDGTPLLAFTGTPDADTIFIGDVGHFSADIRPVGARLLQIAGPGQDWSGPTWMTGAADGATAALHPAESGLGVMPDDLGGENGAMSAIIGALMGAVAGSGPDRSQAQPAAAPTLAPLGPRTVDLQGMDADQLIDLIVPFGSVAD